MATAREQHTDNIVLGAGEIFLDLYGSDGNPTGAERYLGDAVGATISVTTERTTIQSGTGAVARDLVDVVRSVTRTIGLTLHDSSIANWALFLIGETDEQAIAAAPTPFAVSAPKAGMWYQLGQTADNPSGPGKIAAIVKANVKTGATGALAAISDDDFAKLEVDENTARFRLTSALATAEHVIEITYTPSEARTISQAKTTAAASQTTCALRYVEVEPPGGQKGRNVYARKCNLVPGGESSLMSRDTEHQLAFTGNVIDPGGGVNAGYAPLVIDGEEV